MWKIVTIFFFSVSHKATHGSIHINGSPDKDIVSARKARYQNHILIRTEGEKQLESADFVPLVLRITRLVKTPCKMKALQEVLASATTSYRRYS